MHKTSMSPARVLRVLLPFVAVIIGTGSTSPSTAAADSRPPLVLVFPRCDEGTDTELKSVVDNAAPSLNQGKTGWSITATRRIGPYVCSKSRSGGFARSPIDGYIPFTEDTVQPIGSTSKVITGAVVLDVLAAQQPAIPVTSKIGPYLPFWWVRASGVDNITFQELLQHRSGLPNNDDTDTASLKQWLIGGCPTVTCMPAANSGYNNSGYVLLQLLAVSIAKKAEFTGLVPLFVNGNLDEAHYAGEFLEEWAKDSFFADAAAASKASCTYDSSTMAFTYPPNAQDWTRGFHPQSGGLYAADGHPGCGTGRWNFSSRGLASLIERLSSGLAIPKVLSDSMKQNLYGFYRAGKTPIDSDPWVRKGGLLPWGTAATSAAYASHVYVLPKGTAVAAVVNGNADLDGIIEAAWDARSPK